MPADAHADPRAYPAGDDAILALLHGLLRRTDLSTPSGVPAVIVDEARCFGARDVALYPVDYDLSMLMPRRRGEMFTIERLAQFIEHEAAAGKIAPETLRRLRHAVIGREAAALRDDATAVLLEWRGDARPPSCRRRCCDSGDSRPSTYAAAPVRPLRTGRHSDDHPAI